ncbi:MAG: FAD:protein FMN transferase [Raoultibacter sp.]
MHRVRHVRKHLPDKRNIASSLSMNTRELKPFELKRFPSKVLGGAFFGAFFLVIISVLLLSSCADIGDKKTERSFFAMDTSMTITAYGSNTDAALDKAVARTKELENLFAPSKTTSDVHRLNQAHNVPQTVSSDTFSLITQAQAISEATRGAFDISIFPAVAAWGFDAGNHQIPSAETLKALVKDIDYRRIELNEATSSVALPERAQIDLGGIAKGYTGDVLFDVLQKEGVSSAVIDLGGNVSVVGARPDGSPWKIGIQDPFDPSSHFATLSLTNGSVATAGTYERFFTDEAGNRYWHILDAKTGYPANTGLESVSVIAPQATRCDGLSTALFALGLDDALAYWRTDPSFEAVFVTTTKDVYLTEGLADVFTCTNSDSFTQSVVNR